MKRSIAVMVSLLAGTFLVSCATRHEHNRTVECPPPPSWTQNPKINDSVNMYRVGTATGEPTAVAAREAAYKDALRQINQSVLREAVGSVSGKGVSPLPLENVEVLPGCSYTVQTLTGYDGWVQVSFPLTEKNKLLESLKTKSER